MLRALRRLSCPCPCPAPPPVRIDSQPPFEGMSPVDAARAAAYERRRPILGPGLAPELVALLRDCWHPTPSSRPIFEARARAQFIRAPAGSLRKLPVAFCVRRWGFFAPAEDLRVCFSLICAVVSALAQEVINRLEPLEAKYCGGGAGAGGAGAGADQGCACVVQ